MSMGGLNKFCTCWWCHNCACCVAQCIDQWGACEACGLAYLSCGACCWTLLAPICHKCECGDGSAAGGHCMKCLKFCLYACCLDMCAPIDGCYNCIMYIKEICSNGVTGFGDILKNTKWINSMIREKFGLENGSEPEKTFKTYTP
jgi:hypothetical protein